MTCLVGRIEQDNLAALASSCSLEIRYEYITSSRAAYSLDIDICFSLIQPLRVHTGTTIELTDSGERYQNIKAERMELRSGEAGR